MRVALYARVSTRDKDRTPAAANASELTRLRAVILGLGLVVGGVNNQAVRLSDQLLPELPAPGLLAARVLVGLVGAGLLAWGLWGLWVGPALIRLRPPGRGRAIALN